MFKVLARSESEKYPIYIQNTPNMALIHRPPIERLAELACGTGVPYSSRTPTPLGSPQVPRHWATAGYYGGGGSYERGTSVLLEALEPQKALRGGIPCSFLEPFARSWSHFVGIYRQKLINLPKMTFD